MEPPRPNPHAANVPSEIGGFRIQRVLGAGGMATVYAALQTQPRRTVALKLMKAAIASDRARHRFKREVEILGKLHHPYIAQVYSAGMHDDGAGGVPYFVMEYVSDAKTILEFVAARQLDVRERLKLFVKVCAAVEHGHRRKIVHRDLKPGNILIDAAGEPKVIDFGVAHAAEIDLAAQTMHTEAGALVGTLHYMAPEQVDTQPRDIDARCDVYALGAVLYKLLTGRPPHDLTGLQVIQAARVIREQVPRPPGEIRPEVLGDLETIILKSLEHDPERRYANAGSLGRDIVRYLSRKPIHARRASLRYRAMLMVKRNVVPISAAAIVFIVIALAAGIVALDRLSNRTSPPSASTPPAAVDAEAKTSPPPPPPLVAERPETPQPYELNVHSGRVRDIEFSDDGRHMVSGADDHTLIIWNIETQEDPRTIREFEEPVRHVLFGTAGQSVFATGLAGPILQVDVATGRVAKTLRVKTDEILAMALSVTGSDLAYAGSDLAVHVHAVDQWEDRGHTVIRSNSGEFSSVAFSRDGRWIAGGTRGAIVFGEVRGSHHETLPVDLGQVIRVRFLNTLDDSWRWVAVDEDGKGASGKFEPGVDNSGWTPFRITESSIIDAAINIETTRLACTTSNDILIWTLQRNPPLPLGRRLTLPSTPLAVALDPTGKWIAAGDSDGKITVLPILAEH